MAVFLTLLLPDNSFGQDPVDLTVRVQEAGTGESVGGATVTVEGTATGTTDSNGFVRFPDLAPDEYRLIVAALGYRTYDERVAIDRDSVIILLLSPTPIPLDSIVVRPRSFSLLAEVVGSDTDLGVPDADVTVGGNVRLTDAVGFLRMSQLPANVPLEIDIRAIGYMPATIPLLASEDTLIRIVLEPDPVGQKMIERQHERLDHRVRATPYSLRTLTRQDVNEFPAASLLHSLKLLGIDITRIACVVVDDNTRFAEYLNVFQPEQIERVYVIDRGRTIRVYTYSYVRRQLPRKEVLSAVRMGFCM